MSRRKRNDIIANRVQTFQFRGKVYGARGRTGTSEKETRDPNWIPGRDNTILLPVEQDPRKHSIKIFGSIQAILKVLPWSASSSALGNGQTCQRYNDLTVGVGLIWIRVLELLAKDPMVVYLSIDSQGHTSVLIN